MNFHAVKSTNVGQIGYDPATRLFRIVFLNGSIYEHSGVEEIDFNALANAGSVGSHYRKVFAIKYPAFTKISGGSK